MSAGLEASAAVVRELTGAEARAAVPSLAAVLLDAVAGGASVSFMDGLTRADAEAHFAAAADEVAAGARHLFVALNGGAVAGTVQLVPAPQPNQPHRADLSKMLVHRAHRRRGIGAALGRAAEARARALGRWLVTLDTQEGGGAEALYEGLGYHRTGVVPGYALWPDGRPGSAVFYWRDLRDGPDPRVAPAAPVPPGP